MGRRPRPRIVNRYGDPLGLKSNTWVSLLAPICDEAELRAAAELRRHAPRIERRRASSRVHYRDPSGQPATVDGKVVVVACSAIEIGAAADAVGGASRPSSTAGSTRTICSGKYFLTHCFGGASAVMPGRFDKSLTRRQRLGDRLLRAPTTFIRANGPVGRRRRSTTTRPTRRCRSRWRARTAATDLDTLWQAFIDDTSLIGDGLARFPATATSAAACR